MKEIILSEVLTEIVIQEIKNQVGRKARYTDEAITKMASEQEFYDYDTVVTAMKEACKRVLALADENAVVEVFENGFGGKRLHKVSSKIVEVGQEEYASVHSKSILDTVNQIK